MPQAHLDRLSSIDASFLTNESSDSHMHVGAVMIFEGPPPNYNDFLEHVREPHAPGAALPAEARLPPAELGRPFWVDDPTFNLSYHVRHSALPSPGSEEQLRNIAGRVYSQALDRSKPLWEIWLVQGLEKNRFALINKTHHALVDGVAGVDIATVLFDLKPVPEQAEPERAWVPSPAPSSADLAAEGVRELAETPFRLARRAVSAASHPARRRRARPPTRSRRWARSPGTSPTRRPTSRSTSTSARTAASAGAGPASRTTSGSRTRSAAPSTTSC